METRSHDNQDSSRLFTADSGPAIRKPLTVIQAPQIGHGGPGPSDEAIDEFLNQPTGHDVMTDTDDPSILGRRAATVTEASGKRVLTRAATTAAFGGLVIGITSMAFGPRFLASDVRILGIFVGLTILGLALVAPLYPRSHKTSLGVLIVACSIAAFPIAAGGYFIGSIVAIIGGSILVAYEPPPEDVHVIVHRSGRVRRLTGLFVDFLIAFVIQRILYRLVPSFFNDSLNVYISWVACWLFACCAPTVATRRTPGRILVVLRVAHRSTGGRSGAARAFIREALRGTIALAAFFFIARSAISADFRLIPALVATAIVVGVGFLAEQFQVMDRLTGTTSVYDHIVANEPTDTRD